MTPARISSTPEICKTESLSFKASHAIISAVTGSARLIIPTLVAPRYLRDLASNKYGRIEPRATT
jgi:hypothetical protein